ncbi:MAG: hypothetical protein GTO40_07980 [Deltaproteobacteria bacterium]|nr:hypothetical protein [Deltaproteobacteria bacterium]
MREDWIKQIEDTTARFRAGEAEVGRVFFSKPRPLAQHVKWLKHQISREARNLREASNHYVKDLVDRTDDSVTRERLIQRAKEDYQEYRHYGMLAYLYEGITGNKLQWKALLDEAQHADWWLPRREREVRRRLAETSQLHNAAGAFNSGGGGSLFYGFIGLKGGDYEELLSEVSKIVLHDEMDHGASEGRDLLYPLVRTEEDFNNALAAIREFSTVRLEDRNRQFSDVLSDNRLRAIIEGDIEPATTDLLAEASHDLMDDETWFERFHGTNKPLSSVSVQS